MGGIEYKNHSMCNVVCVECEDHCLHVKLLGIEYKNHTVCDVVCVECEDHCLYVMLLDIHTSCCETTTCM